MAPRVVLLLDAFINRVFASVGLAKRLEARGYVVEYWGGARRGVDTLVAEQGFTFRTIDGLWSRYEEEIRLPTDLNPLTALARVPVLLEKLQRRRQWRRRLPEALDRFERAFDALNDAYSPTLVILDPFLLAYYPMLRARKINTIVLSTKPLPDRDLDVPPYDSSLLPTGTMLNRCAIALTWQQRRLSDLVYRCAQRAARAVAAYNYHDVLLEASRRTGFDLRTERVRRWVQPDLHFRDVHEWALSAPQVDLPRRRALPTNSRYIGSNVYTTRRTRAPRVNRPVGVRYLIYAAVGTVRFRWKDNVPILSKLVAAFGGLVDVSLVISTGDERATAALGTPPKNIQLFDFVDQLSALGAADLMITHGGAGTLRECVERVVPMLAYPAFHDQFGNAVRIEYHGIGLRGSREADTPEMIRSKAFRILNDRGFKERLGVLHAVASRSEEALLSDALNAVGAEAYPVVRMPRPAVRAVTS